MKHNHPFALVALAALLLISSAAGAVRAAELQAGGLTAQPKLEYIPYWRFGGINQGDQMGVAVAGVGDVNGDTYPDILIGADKGGASRQGQAVLFFGGASGPHNTPDWNVIGDTKGGQYGVAVDGGGDVNGDGYADIVVGASNYAGLDPSNEPGEGAVYVYHGSLAGPSLAPDWMIEGNLQNVMLGASVAMGYINGDAYADLVVGMPGYTNGAYTSAGAAWAYFGSSTGLNTAYGWYEYGLQASSQLGLEVSFVGDVNGDGYGDIMVGEPYYDNYSVGYLDAGAVYLYLGTQFGLSMDPAWTLIGSFPDDRLGTSAAAAGDLNGDGCDDAAIGAPGYNLSGFLNAGRVYVFYGCQGTASGLNSVADWAYTYPQYGANLGISVSGAGDTNQDGYDELLAGMHLYDGDVAAEGAVIAFYGYRDGVITQPYWMVEGNKAETFFGFAVDGAGDINGDGFADVLVGSPTFRVEEILRGSAFLYMGVADAMRYNNLLPFIIR